MSKFKSPPKRKFPGPAGLLNFNPDDANDETLDTTVIPSTQNYFNHNNKAWLEMVCELDDPQLLQSFNIGWIKEKANVGYLVGKKVPFLAAIVMNVHSYFKNYSVSLMDATGEITAYLTTEAYEMYKEELVVNSVAIFVQFSILTIPHTNNHYLTITNGNLLTIYTPQTNQTQTQKTSNIKITNVQKPDVLRKWTKNVPGNNFEFDDDDIDLSNVEVFENLLGNNNKNVFKPPEFPQSKHNLFDLDADLSDSSLASEFSAKCSKVAKNSVTSGNLLKQAHCDIPITIKFQRNLFDPNPDLSSLDLDLDTSQAPSEFSVKCSKAAKNSMESRKKCDNFNKANSVSQVERSQILDENLSGLDEDSFFSDW